LGKLTGNDVPAVGASIGFEPVTMLIKERGISFDVKPNLSLIYDKEDDIEQVYKTKQTLMASYNVSLFLRPKNIKNFYDRIISVADYVTSYKDIKENKEIKKLK